MKDSKLIPGALPTTTILTDFFLSKTAWTPKYIYIYLGVHAEVKFIATNVYQATFKKSLENKKNTKMTNDWDGTLKKTFKKVHKNTL